MSFPFITAEKRLAEKRGSKGVILGPSGVGKTTLLKTADATRTLFIDLEAGDLAVLDWPGDSVRPRTWQECRDLACYIGGPNPALRDDQSYSQAHYDQVCALYGDPAMLAKYSLIFVDSITVAGRLCLQWAKGQPQAFSEKTGKPDTRGPMGCMPANWSGGSPSCSMSVTRTSGWSGSSTKSSMTSTARCSALRSKAPKPRWNCPALSIRSSRWWYSSRMTAPLIAPSSASTSTPGATPPKTVPDDWKSSRSRIWAASFPRSLRRARNKQESIHEQLQQQRRLE